jgi:BolA protein
MTVETTIAQKLKAAFAPSVLQIVNESSRHAGHAAMRAHKPEQPGETHFRIHIVAAAFAGKSRIDRHRMINSALADELAGPVHALAIAAHAPGEDAAKA